MAHNSKPKFLRVLYGAFGILCVGVGFVGLVTPVMPGFVFFLIALWAFRNSSEQLEHWLLNNKRIGPTLRDWDEDRSMKLQTKVIAIASIWIAITSTSVYIYRKPRIIIPQWDFELPKAVPIGVLIITLVWLTLYLVKVPTRKPQK